MLKKFMSVSFGFIYLFSFSQSSEKLHQRAIVADTHNDILSTIVQKGYDLGNDLKDKTHTDLSRLKKGGVDIQIFSIFCDERYGKGTAFNYALREMDTLQQVVLRNPDKIMLVQNPAQLKSAIRAGKIAGLTGVEGGHMIEDRMDYLDSFYKRGARYMTLTWNNSTSWASSAADESKGQLPFGSKGLTAFGKQVVQHMNELGMMVDVSHVGEQTFRDVITTTSKPVIASHSSVYGLCAHPRNLKDDQILAIGKNGGVIFINFYSGFIDSNYMRSKAVFLQFHKQETDSLIQLKWPMYEVEDWLSKKYAAETELFRPKLEQLIDHFDYIIKLIGVDHVGLGSDFDGIESAPQGLDGVENFPRITQALLQRGYNKKDINKILGENFLRVFKSVSSSNN
ncbi:MAG: membrane dipeptidase [Chitinophagaceae bacterium]|nr:membrane dipeptidase [Chitinophagaceae bacterium]